MSAEERRTALYRMSDAAGVLLYVGVTVNPMGRFAQHQGEKPWWDEVASVTVEYFGSGPLALEAETAAIEAEAPRYNRAKNRRYVPATSPRSLTAPTVPVLPLEEFVPMPCAYCLGEGDTIALEPKRLVRCPYCTEGVVMVAPDGLCPDWQPAYERGRSHDDLGGALRLR